MMALRLSLGPTSPRPDLVINGDFSASDGWVVAASWSIAGGVATHTPGSVGRFRRLVELSEGIAYRVTYDLIGVTAGTVRPDLRQNNDTGFVVGTNQSGDGTYSEILIATAATNSIAFQCSSDFAGSVDNVSLRRA